MAHNRLECVKNVGMLWMEWILSIPFIINLNQSGLNMAHALHTTLYGLMPERIQLRSHWSR